MTQRVFLVCPERPPHIQRRVFEVLSYDRAKTTIHLQYPDRRILIDINFHIDIAKRIGYSLTAEVPPEFANAKQPQLQA